MDPMRPNTANVPVQPHSGMPQRPQPAPRPAKSGKRKGSAKKIVKLGVAILIIAALGFFGWKYMQAQKELQRLSNPQEAAQEETKRLMNEVGKLIVLPEGETPTVATVVDASKLKEQPFFAKAENGDRVIIYTQNRKAILYRPSSKKIIEVAPINLGNSQTGTGTNQ